MKYFILGFLSCGVLACTMAIMQPEEPAFQQPEPPRVTDAIIVIEVKYTPDGLFETISDMAVRTVANTYPGIGDNIEVHSHNLRINTFSGEITDRLIFVEKK